MQRHLRTISAAAIILAALLAVTVVLVARSGSSAVLGVLIASTCLASGLGLAMAIGGSSHLHPPIWVVAVSQALMFVARPLYSITFQESHNIFTGSPYDTYFIQAQAVCGVGFVCICTSYAWALRGNSAVETLRPPPVTAPAEKSWANLRPWLIVALAGGFALYGLFVLQVGVGNYLSITASGRSEEYLTTVTSNSGYFVSGLRFAQGVVLLFLGFAVVQRKYPVAVLWSVILGITVIPSVAAGDRSVFIPLIVAFGIFVARVRPGSLTVSRILPVVPPLYIVGIVAPGVWRESLSTGGSFADAVGTSLEPENVFGGFVGGLDTAMIDAFQLQVQAQDAQSVPLHYGSSYAAALLAWVPRNLWPGKPLSVDTILNNFLFPETAAKNIGFAFSFYSEPYFNFGLLGVVVVCAICGFALGRVTRSTMRSSKLMNAYYYSLTAGFSFVIMRGNLTFDIQRLVVLILPVLLATLASSVWRNLQPVQQDTYAPQRVEQTR